MNQEDIRRRRSHFEAEIRKAEEAGSSPEAKMKKELLQKKLEDLQRRCPHPQKSSTAIFGFAMDYCADCGWQD